MPRSTHQCLVLVAATALLCAMATPARALERITLRNGFSYDCARWERVDGAHLRLYPTGGDQGSFIEVPAAEVVGVEALPPPPEMPAKAAASAKVSATAKASPTDVHALLTSAGTAHNIDVELLASIVHAESSGHTQAVSRTGAQGLMQLMPGTARSVGVTDAFQPDQNINGGTTYLDWLLTRYKDNLAFALAAYNAGPGAVDRFHGIPPYRETRAYVARVMTEFKRRKLALEQRVSPTLQASR